MTFFVYCYAPFNTLIKKNNQKIGGQNDSTEPIQITARMQIYYFILSGGI